MSWFTQAVANSVLPEMKRNFATESPITYFSGADSTGYVISAIVTTIDNSITSEEDRVLNASRLNLIVEVLDMYEKPKDGKDYIQYQDEQYTVLSHRTVSELVYEIIVERSDIQGIGHGRRSR